MVRKKKCTIAPVKICQPATRAAYSEMCSIKGPTGLQNHTVEELEEDADCISSDDSKFLLPIVLQPN